MRCETTNEFLDFFAKISDVKIIMFRDWNIEDLIKALENYIT